jgi:hypothetical protein
MVKRREIFSEPAAAALQDCRHNWIASWRLCDPRLSFAVPSMFVADAANARAEHRKDGRWPEILTR